MTAIRPTLLLKLHIRSLIFWGKACILLHWSNVNGPIWPMPKRSPLLMGTLISSSACLSLFVLCLINCLSTNRHRAICSQLNCQSWLCKRIKSPLDKELVHLVNAKLRFESERMSRTNGNGTATMIAETPFLGKFDFCFAFSAFCSALVCVTVSRRQTT